ncbi:MAG TPA: beta-ketoacyl synthase N-terminal-like domain-containing protein [Polyangiaceae bacterium]|jgi:acyl transferase domain-containing protein
MATEQELREYLRKATALLQETKQRLREEQEARRQPIAIVSMACRLPRRIETPEALWEAVARGEDTTSDPPPHRGWDEAALLDPDPDAPGKAYSLRAGFLHDADAFDAAFFELSAREATLMDPQQRLLLEVSWEAFERAGIPAPAFRGSRTAVYAGVMENAYAAHLLATPEAHDRNVSLGSRASVASSRIAYALGLSGTAVSIDTACSSSLVALHLACQALRTGECDLALAGGATVLPTPTLFIESSRQRGLAADGRCKPFSAAADGIGWAEGVGMVVLERLSDARRNGHPVLGLVRGSALNNDGRGQGFTAPSGRAQEALIRDALRAAGVDPGEVDAVEAHGTGTTVGDSIEAQALLETYGRARSDGRPLWVGNAKPSFGHSQAAAGVIGVMKSLLSMARGRMPGMPRVGAWSELVDWSSQTVRPLADERPWDRNGHPRRAGVSAFGVGTNAHVILEEAPEGIEPEPRVVEPAPGEPLALLVSAKSEGALRAQAGRLADHLERTDDSLIDVAWTLARHRTAFPVRAGVVVTDRVSAIAALRSLESGAPSPSVVLGVDQEYERAVFVLAPDAGAIAAPVLRSLADREPAFAKALDACRAAFAPYAGADADGAARFAAAFALAETWRAWGVHAAAWVAAGDGALVAACAAGSLSLEEAVRRCAGASTGRLEVGRATLPLYAADRLADAEAAARAAGHAVFLHVRPPTARADLLREAVALYVRGGTVDFSVVLGAGRFVPLPTYAFQRSRYWIERARPAISALPSRAEGPARAPTLPLATLAAMPADERAARLGDLVRTEVAAVLGLAGPHDVELDRPLFQMGCDSLRATELRNRLRAGTDAVLPATLVFDHPTVEAIVALLERMVSSDHASSAASPLANPSSSPTAPERSYEEFDL